MKLAQHLLTTTPGIFLSFYHRNLLLNNNSVIILLRQWKNIHFNSKSILYLCLSTLNARVCLRVSARIVYAKGVCLRACIRLCGREWEWWV